MIKVFVGKAGSGKTYNIKKNIRQQMKKNPSSKIGIVTPCIQEYDDLEDIRENLKFADTKEVMLSDYFGKDRVDVFIIDSLQEHYTIPSFLGYLIKYSEVTDIVISVQEANPLLLEVADIIHFCDRAREGALRKAERLEIKTKELGM